MENSQQLATESFSYSWLITAPPPPKIRKFEDDDEFRFDIPSSSSPDLANADEIFLEGQIMPMHAAAARSAAAPSPAAERKRNFSLARWRRSSRKILRRWLEFVNWRVGCARKSIRVDDLQRKVLESLEASPRRSSSSAYSDCGDELYCLKIDRNWRNSPIPTSPSYACCDGADENSIREAILYCKKSIEK